MVNDTKSLLSWDETDHKQNRAFPVISAMKKQSRVMCQDLRGGDGPRDGAFQVR